MSFSRSCRVAASGALLAMAALPLIATPALASPDGIGVVINEAFVAGGNNGAALNADFVELYNPSAEAVDLNGWSLQYRSAGASSPSSGGQIMPLSGTIAPQSTFLITGPTGASGAALPAGDLATTLAAGAGGGQILLAKTTAPIQLDAELDGANVADFIGYGNANRFEGTAAAPSATVALSLNRTDYRDSDDNAADFVTAAPTPINASGETTGTPGEPEEPAQPGEAVEISAIQGTTDTSPYAGQTVTARGIVTAAYPSGNFAGYYIQTPGTGVIGDDHAASDAVFVYSSATVGSVAIGDYVEVTGVVSEFYGLTEITVAAGAMTKLDASTVEPVIPAAVGFPADPAAREALEGMLIAPQGDYTVTDTYTTNQYAEVALAASAEPFVTPTALGAPGSAEYAAAQQRMADELVVLDDGASLDFFRTVKDQPIPYLTGNVVRVGAAVTFDQPVILDYRNNAWKFQPTQQLTAANADTVQPVSFENDRPASPELTGGDLRLATFNVLNYFPTTGDQVTGCEFYEDRIGNPIAVADGCSVRGAANAENLERQQDKIVAAINGLGADVVSLEEIENSLAVGHNDRDSAVATLVEALNEDAGEGTWAYAPSPAELPSREDVIRTAFIYQPAAIELQGEGVILDTENFKNARQPYAQGFMPVGGEAGDAFVVIANHLKSKGDSSNSASGDNTDTGDGAGAYNGDRTRQANDLVEFAADMQTEFDTDKLYLVGDFNSYAAEDPIRVLAEAGYIDQGAKSGKHSYSFQRAVGSLDYIFASPAADATVADSDIWNINSGESVALEYSRYNYNVTDFYSPDQYRSSDHDPVLVEIGLGENAGDEVKQLNLLNINDFHGRIDANTVKFAGTIEQLRAEYPGSTAFLSNGDNIGASLFASSVAEDQPTIDVLNALGLQASAVGNHEFDQGYDDLNGRVSTASNFPYLGANVTIAGEPALQPFEIIDVDGVRVAVIGAVTEETPSLVSPGGIAGVEFGDPVDAVNKYAALLTDGDESNGEADVIVAEYHEGAKRGEAEKSTLAEQLADGGVFAKIVNETSSEVDVIFNGHTHATYAWTAEVPGAEGKTRPVLQTGSYGENIGQVVLEYNVATGETEAIVNHNVPRTTTADDELLNEFAVVKEVKQIVDEALANAAEVGDQVIGAATADITTAFVGDTRDDRASESTLGNFVADSLLSTLSSADRGGAEIGMVNPGGLRAELEQGEISYAEANAVLPFLNNLWTTTLTGAQFKTVLEQQWQRTAGGDVPSRSYLQLGLSENVSYTFDSNRAEGDRITSITVNGQSIDLDREYRIGSFSFLLQGGDNFHEFKNGKDTKDSGLVDRDAWIEYIQSNSPVSPNYERRSVEVSGLPEGEVQQGAQIELQFSKLDLTSRGVPANTEIAATFALADAPTGTGADEAGASAITASGAATVLTAPVADGQATLSFAVPSDIEGAVVLTVIANATGTTVQLPLTIAADVSGGGNAGGGSAGADGGAGGSGNANGTGTGLVNAGGESMAALLLAGLALLAVGGLLAARRVRQN